MGTVLDVTVVAANAGDARRLAEAAILEVRRWDDILTTWRADGELARFNTQAGRGAVPVSGDLASALRSMLALRVATRGAFDPLMGADVRAWSAPGGNGRRRGAAESSAAAALSVGEHSATLSATIEIDAGGIGKGIALDAAAQRLRAVGVQAAFLNFGGSSQTAIGVPPDDRRGWPVMVSGGADGAAHGVIWLRDASLSTSRASAAGDEAGPIIDPRSRLPVDIPRVATVLAPDATRADAWSTALVVLGRDGLDRAMEAGVGAIVDDGTGLATTPGFPLARTPR